MPVGTGITSDTPAALVIGAGVMLRDHAFMGPTVDNNLFGLDRTMVTPELNGSKWFIINTDYIQRSQPRLEATIPEVNADRITAGIPGATVDTSTPGMAIISEDDERRLDSADLADYELDVEAPNGGQFQFEIDNAINTAPWEGDLSDDGLFAPRYNLQGRAGFDGSGNLVAPWRIRKLDVAS